MQRLQYLEYRYPQRPECNQGIIRHLDFDLYLTYIWAKVHILICVQIWSMIFFHTVYYCNSN